jgi:hypothetical protein
MRTLTLSAIALATALTAGMAVAQPVNPGVAQLAAEAGVSPMGYTQNQLILLINAQRNSDDDEIAFLKAQANKSMTASTMNGYNAGAAQLAADVGVEPGKYFINELTRLERFQTRNSSDGEAFILSGANRASAEPASVVTPGKMQIAAALGVNPAHYTLSELALLQADQSRDN